MAPPKEIPGFYYDEQKDRYFPDHMKADFIKEKKRREREELLQNVSASSAPIDLNRFMRNSPIRFDSLTEKLNRLKVVEIHWPHQIQLNPDKEIYYRYTWKDGEYTIQHIKPFTDNILREFSYKCSGHVLVDFKVIETEPQSYYFIKEEEYSTTSMSGNLDILSPAFRTMLTETVTYGSHGYNIAYFNNQLILAQPRNTVSPDGSFRCSKICLFTFILPLNTETPASTKPFDPFEFLCYQHGVDPLQNCFIATYKQLKKMTGSAAKWLYHDKDQEKLLVLTYHGSLYALGPQFDDILELFQVEDLLDGKFDDLIIRCRGKLLLMGFRRGEEIFAVDWTNPRRIMKTINLSLSALETFEMSSDFSSLQVHLKH